MIARFKSSLFARIFASTTAAIFIFGQLLTNTAQDLGIPSTIVDALSGAFAFLLHSVVLLGCTQSNGGVAGTPILSQQLLDNRVGIAEGRYH